MKVKRKAKLLCEVCGEETESTNGCELCGKLYGSCCSSMRDSMCIECTDGGSDDDPTARS